MVSDFPCKILLCVKSRPEVQGPERLAMARDILNTADTKLHTLALKVDVPEASTRSTAPTPTSLRSQRFQFFAVLANWDLIDNQNGDTTFNVGVSLWCTHAGEDQVQGRSGLRRELRRTLQGAPLQIGAAKHSLIVQSLASFM